MQQKIINPQDLAFQLYELHEVEKTLRFDRYADHCRGARLGPESGH